MKQLGITLLVIIGTILGLYVGIWVMFIGGIGTMITAYQSGAILMGIFGFIKFTLSGFVGWGLFVLFLAIAQFFDG
jgi:hypothetical protein